MTSGLLLAAAKSTTYESTSQTNCRSQTGRDTDQVSIKIAATAKNDSDGQGRLPVVRATTNSNADLRFTQAGLTGNKSVLPNNQFTISLPIWSS